MQNSWRCSHHLEHLKPIPWKISILAQLHGELDATVSEAYGWSTDFKSLKSSTDSTDSTDSKTRAFKKSVESVKSVDNPFCGISDADILTRLDTPEGPRYHKPVAMAAGA